MRLPLLNGPVDSDHGRMSDLYPLLRDLLWILEE